MADLTDLLAPRLYFRAMASSLYFVPTEVAMQGPCTRQRRSGDATCRSRGTVGGESTGEMSDIKERLAALDWSAIERSLWEHGYARTPPVLTRDECDALRALYPDDTRFRSRVDMARYRFGVGEYKYFAAPLPPLVEALRVHAYAPLAAIANQWEVALDTAVLHPPTLAALLARCRKKGQTKPTPLL